MNFRKDIEPCCAYCKYGEKVTDERVACVKFGVRPLYGACGKFVYAPIKRRPDRPRKLRTTESDEARFAF